MTDSTTPAIDSKKNETSSDTTTETTKQNKIARGIFQYFDFINNKVQKITKLIIIVLQYRRLTLDELRRRLHTVLTWSFD